MNKILAKMRAVGSLASEFGLRAAYVTQIEFHLTRTSKKEAYFLRKHDFITDMLQAKLQSAIDSFKQVDWSPEPAARTEERLIWVFWWQGEDAMPDLVRMCCDLLSPARRTGQAGDPLVEGQSRPTCRPPRLRHEEIGRWIDHACTIYGYRAGSSPASARGALARRDGLRVAGISDAVFAPFFAIRHQRIVKYAALGRWTGFALGGHKGGALFAFLSAAICKYWERENLLIDYYLLDYLINLADRCFPGAHGIIEFERVDRQRDFRIGGRVKPRARRGSASEGHGAERLSQALLEGSPALEEAGRRGYEFRGPAASAGGAQIDGPGR